MNRNSIIIDHICYIAYRPEKYNGFIYKFYETEQTPKEAEAILLSNDPQFNIKFSILIYTCYGTRETPETSVPTDEYKIASGPSVTSVILIHKTNNRLEVTQLILDLDLRYVIHYKHY